MRHSSSITSLSWIPSEAIEGSMRLAFDAGFTHYDPPPPDVIEDLEALRVSDRFRFANVLSAWVDVDGDGTITGCGYDGGGSMGSTTVKVGPLSRTFEAVALPDLQQEPERGDGWVRFVQTAGGRTGLPAPRRVRRRPFVQWQAPLVWTTLTLTLHADGRADAEVVGTQPLSAPLDLRPRGQGCRTSRASPTSTTGSASRSDATPRGAMRSRRRWSRRSRPRSSADSRRR